MTKHKYQPSWKCRNSADKREDAEGGIVAHIGILQSMELRKSIEKWWNNKQILKKLFTVTEIIDQRTKIYYKYQTSKQEMRVGE